MKKNFVLSGLILIALLVIASNTGFVQETKTGNIAGVVYSGGPLPGALVVVRRLSGEWEESIEYKGVGGKIERIWRKTVEKINYTDSLGRYFFAGIEPGEYEMYARGESGLYKTETYEWHYDYKMTNAKGIKVAPDSTSIVNFGVVPGLLSVEPPLIEHEDAIIACDSSCFFRKKFEEIFYIQPVTKDSRYKTGNIAGIVFDIQTMQPLSGAWVYIEGMREMGTSTKSDTLGRFWLSNVRVGKYNIRAEKIYYYSGMISEVKVANDSTSIVLFRLVYTLIPERPWPYPWEENKVKCDSAEFYNNYYKALLRKK